MKALNLWFALSTMLIFSSAPCSLFTAMRIPSSALSRMLELFPAAQPPKSYRILHGQGHHAYFTPDHRDYSDALLSFFFDANRDFDGG